MAKMFGIVRSRFETFISSNRLLPFNSRRFANPNAIGISKYASASFKGKGHHPQPPPLPTRMKDKLMNVLLRGIVSITGHTAIDNPYESIDEIGGKSNWRSSIKKFIYGADWDSRKNFEFDKNDLASDENLWILYDRWINFHGLSRTPEEKQQHFQPFKESAHRVYYSNKIYKSFQCGLNLFADMTKEEKRMLCGGGVFNDQLSCKKNKFGFRGIEVDSRKLFEFEEKDLASEDNLEKLYDQWICYFGLSRDPKEKDVHFQAFKKCVRNVYSSNIAFNIRRHEVNEYADTTREERRMRLRYGFRVEKKTAEEGSESSVRNSRDGLHACCCSSFPTGTHNQR